MADALPGELTDDEVLAAVAEHRGLEGDDELRRLASGARIEHQPLLDCTITRCIESRTTGEETRPAPFDLSGRPVVDDLDAYRQDPPKDPRRRETVRIVLDGSVREVPCHDCSNGKQQCPNCKGTGRLHCEPQVPCTDCKSVTSCTKCRGRGGSRKAPVTPAAVGAQRLAPAQTARTRRAAEGETARRAGRLRPVRRVRHGVSALSGLGQDAVHRLRRGRQGAVPALPGTGTVAL
jgi:hypothetical protein